MVTQIQQRTTLNSKNIFTQYGVCLVKGAYKALIAGGEYKDAVTNASPTEGGTRVVELPLSLRQKKQREVSFSVVTTQVDVQECVNHLTALTDEAADGTGVWAVPTLGVSFRLTLTKTEQPEFYRNGMLVTAVQKLTFIEYNPAERTQI